MAPRAGEHSDANCIYCAAVLGSPSQHLLTLVAAASLAAGLAACGDDDSDTSSTSAAEATTSVKAVSTDTCGDVEYGGSEEPDVLITSDLPLQGDSAKRSEQQVEAIRLALDDAEWKAGDTNVAFQSCDDTIAKTGLWDVKTCQDNATAYAEDPDVIGVIGTYNSGCAAEIIPILNEAPGGPVAMISPGNTAVDLTASDEVLPERRAQLRARDPQRRLPGRRPGRARRRQVGRRHDRRAVRRRRLDQHRPGRQFRGRGEGARAQDRVVQLGPEGQGLRRT